ncbi:MAG: hypothetical protein KKB62_01935 [Nanoarchaeota archaeon]|nr:hypothetical protein [Nanoarchaeota archaeon]
MLKTLDNLKFEELKNRLPENLDDCKYSKCLANRRRNDVGFFDSILKEKLFFSIPEVYFLISHDKEDEYFKPEVLSAEEKKVYQGIPELFFQTKYFSGKFSDRKTSNVPKEYYSYTLIE